MGDVLNVAVPEIVLNEPGVCALIGESKAAGVAHHVGMDGYGEEGLLAVFVQQQVPDERYRGFRCSLRKNDRPKGLPGAFIRARITSQASETRRP